MTQKIKYPSNMTNKSLSKVSEKDCLHAYLQALKIGKLVVAYDERDDEDPYKFFGFLKSVTVNPDWSATYKVLTSSGDTYGFKNIELIPDECCPEVIFSLKDGRSHDIGKLVGLIYQQSNGGDKDSINTAVIKRPEDDYEDTIFCNIKDVCFTGNINFGLEVNDEA